MRSASGQHFMVTFLPDVQPLSRNCHEFFMSRHSKKIYSTSLCDSGRQYDGLYIRMLEYYAQILNFTFQIIIPNVTTYGFCKNFGEPTEECIGMFGLIAQKKVDFSIFTWQPNYERTKVMRFSNTLPSEMAGWAFMIKKLQPAQYATILFEAFSPNGMFWEVS